MSQPTLRPLSGGRWLLVANDQHFLFGSMEEGLQAAEAKLLPGAQLQLMNYLGELQELHTVGTAHSPEADPAAPREPTPEERPAVSDAPPQHQPRTASSQPRPVEPGPSRTEQPPGVREQVTKEWKRADQVAEHATEHVWPWVVWLLGPSVAYGLVAPQIVESGSFFGAFLATLAWSAGFAVCVALLIHGVLGRYGAGALVLFGFILLGSAILAYGAGHGAYTESVQLSEEPRHWVIQFAAAAIAAYGPVGFVIACIAGGLAGRWLAKVWNPWD